MIIKSGPRVNAQLRSSPAPPASSLCHRPLPSLERLPQHSLCQSPGSACRPWPGPRGQSPWAVDTVGVAGATAPLRDPRGWALRGFISSTGTIGPRSQAEGRCLPGACRLLGRPRSRSAGRPGPTPWALRGVSRVGGHSEPWLLSLGAGVLQSQRGCLEEASRGDEFPK